ncbi:hypothetical protein, partial [uncultured Campylobacter sp.]|uniref:hypothetical protein n=1 Tax=uncultured Campylobacter sp. TaxID=218934 RepID=UPI0025EE2509
ASNLSEKMSDFINFKIKKQLNLNKTMAAGAFCGAAALPHRAYRSRASSKLKAGKAVADSAQQAAIF